MAKKKSRGVAFVITPLGKKAEVTGHGKRIMKTLKRLRKATASQIVKAVDDKKKKNGNVFGVYLWRFTRKGLLKQVAA